MHPERIRSVDTKVFLLEITNKNILRSTFIFICIVLRKELLEFALIHRKIGMVDLERFVSEICPAIANLDTLHLWMQNIYRMIAKFTEKKVSK